MHPNLRKNLIIAVGPLAFVLLLLFDSPEGMSPEAYKVLACTVWIAYWWVTESVPLAITSLLPLLLFPLLGVMSMNESAVPYSKPLIFLFIGGFILALAIEKWNLHKRIALTLVSKVGTNMRQILFGFIFATWFLSMWISNTAMTMMMLPIGISVVLQLQNIINKSGEKLSGAEDFGKALIMSIAFAASIGGMATLVGTPTNLIFADSVQQIYEIEFPFDKWMLFGFPVSLLLMFLCWWHLSHNAFKLSNSHVPGSKEVIQGELNALGKISKEERLVLIIFSIVAICWMLRQYILKPILPAINDTHIALAGALVLFLIRAPSKKEERLMDWETAVKLPWGVILLFGGAFAVAAGFQQSGLTSWIGEKLQLLDAIPLFVILLIIIAVVNFLTEITMNMATCTIMMPLMAALAMAMDVHPFIMMASVCVASSCAFMLPVATAPNAIVFGSNYLKIKDMARAGFMLNVISIIVITLFSYFILPMLWGVDLNDFPF